jgi:hypothetical protein
VQRSEINPDPQAISQSFFLFFSALPADQHCLVFPFETFVSERVAKVRRVFESSSTLQNFFSFPFWPVLADRLGRLSAEAGCKGRKLF